MSVFMFFLSNNCLKVTITKAWSASVLFFFGQWRASEMSQKRPHRGEGCSFDDKRTRKPPSFRSVVMDAMTMHKLQKLAEPVLEPLIRRVVKEEVDLALRKYTINMKRNCGKSILPSESRSLQFLNAISIPVFTGTRIEGEGGSTLEVALLDALTGEIVSSGLESSAKVEIVVLEGDFDGDEGDNWTLEEFANNMVKEREGKKPLLTGDMIVTLKDGIGSVSDISFTDNSSWTRSRKFRLGARLVERDSGVRIKEAKSEPFVVRDHRGELYKKHHPPSLSDKVWRLEKIGKDGAFHKRLSKERVNTVQEFLLLLFLDPTRLRNILGAAMPAKMWEVMVEHAQTCVLDKKLYLYDPSRSLPKSGVVFNVVGQVIGMFANSQYVPADKLSEPEKAAGRELVISAFRDWENILTVDDESFLNSFALSCSSTTESSSNFPTESINHQDLISHKIDKCTYSNVSTPDFMQSVYSIGGMTSSNADYLHCVDPEDINFDQPLSFPSQQTDSLICDTDSMTRAFCANEDLPYFGTDYSLQSSNLELPTDLQSAISAFMTCSAVPTDKARRRWNILLNILKWRFSIRRILARKKSRVTDIPRFCS